MDVNSGVYFFRFRLNLILHPLAIPESFNSLSNAFALVPALGVAGFSRTETRGGVCGNRVEVLGTGARGLTGLAGA